MRHFAAAAILDFQNIIDPIVPGGYAEIHEQIAELHALRPKDSGSLVT